MTRTYWIKYVIKLRIHPRIVSTAASGGGQSKEEHNALAAWHPYT